MNTKFAVDKNIKETKESICYEMLESLKNNLLGKWYPLAVDKNEGGYFTNFSFKCSLR